VIRLAAETRRAHPALTAAAVIATSVAMVPLVYLVVRVVGAGAEAWGAAVTRPRVGTLAATSVALALVVAVGCLVLGVASAYLVTRTDLPGRRVWAVVAALPLAVPSYVAAFSWSAVADLWSSTSRFEGFWAAALVLTLYTAPYVYLPVAAALVGTEGWANPASGHLTSPFGYRTHPITGQHHLHTGSDVANACGSTPVYAAADGVVIWQGAGGYQGRTGNQIVMDHDGTGGVITRYGHVLTGSILVRTGDHVTAGQQIASIGGDPTLDPQGAGGSTGCHLHFEVNLLGIPVDAREHLASHGVQLGS